MVGKHPGTEKPTRSSSEFLRRPLLVEVKIISEGKGKMLTKSRITKRAKKGRFGAKEQ